MREDLTPTPTPARSANAPAPVANGEAEVPPWAAFSPGRGRLVRFVVVFSIALTLLAAASIYWRSANVYEPTSYITVLGDEAHAGTQVVVTSPEYSEPWMVTLTKDNNYIAAIFLHPGSYTVTATLNGQSLAKAPFTVTGRQAVSLNLANRRPGGAVAVPGQAS